jgi:ubiquinone/menaquinone biosynthesis C-methylase UbiE
MNVIRHKVLQKKYEYLNAVAFAYGRIFFKNVIIKLINPIINEYFDNSYTSLLDCGCGGGRYLYGVDKRYTKIYALDWALEMIDEHKDMVGRDRLINLFPVDVCDIPLEDKSVDVAMSTDMFEHLHETMIDKALSEIARVTRYKAYFKIASQPSKINSMCETEFGLGEGQLHETQREQDWWIARIEKYFTRDEEVIEVTGKSRYNSYGRPCTQNYTWIPKKNN